MGWRERKRWMGAMLCCSTGSESGTAKKDGGKGQYPLAIIKDRERQTWVEMAEKQ